MTEHRSKKASLAYEDLKQQITSGELPVGHRLPPEKELAAHYGVAGLTLRKSLKKLRQEGLIVSQRYHGTRVSDPQDSKSISKLIGLILPKSLQALSHPVFTRFADGVEGTISEMGYGLDLVVSNADNRLQEQTLLTKLADQTIDGWLIPASISPQAQEALSKLKKPKVLMHIPNAKISEHCLEVDGAGLAVEILNHLNRSGYRKIWVIAPAAMSNFRDAIMALAGSPFAPAGVRINSRETAGFSVASAREVCLDILNRQDVDAFVCADDELAVGALQALTTKGLKSPDVGVVGGGDFPLSLLTEPPLTTVSYPYYQVGREAARLLIELIENKPVEAVNRRFLPRLIERRSTAREVISQSVTT